MLSAQLLFGLSRPGGGRVSEAAWRRFFDTRITPRFPDGLTVFRARGQWRGKAGRPVREAARVVLIVAADGPESLARLEAVRGDYRAAFAQDSVGLVLSRACAAF